jgi:hypothetical protein
LANPSLNNSQRKDVYRQLFLLNNLFARITQVLDNLANNRLFKSCDLREMSELAQEVQLELNIVLLNPLELAEMNDWNRFGKIRKKMEKKLGRRN